MSGERIRTFLLERIALGEVSEADAQPPLSDAERAELAEIRADNVRTLERYPPAEIEREVQRRLAAAEQPSLPWWPRGLAWTGAAVAASLALIVVYDPTVGGPSDLPADVGATVEPTPSVLVLRRRDGEAVRLEDGAQVSDRDRLEVRYASSGRRYGAVLSIDGAGTVTLHLPEAATATLAAPLASRPTALSRSYAPSEARGFVRFFFVTSDARFRTGEIVDAARRLAAKPEGADEDALEVEGVEQASLLLRKPPP